jgi:UDP-N-acetylmuramoylalanine--D-glutamate ligase
MNAMMKDHTQAQSFLIIGLGQTGLSCARFLTRQGFPVVIMDTRENPPAADTVKNELPDVLVMCGKLNSEWLLKSDVIVLSPGVDPRMAEISQAKDAGIEIIGDIELFARYANAPIIAITGSNGKSTVTTMVAEMAVTAGKQVQVGGNLGVPALELLTEVAPDFYILELSSFQLETVQSLDAFASVVLNVSPDHLDRYDSLEDYQSAKEKIYFGTGIKIINRDDPIVKLWTSSDRHDIGFTLSEPQNEDFGITLRDGKHWLTHNQQALLAVEDMQITGSHNVANALATLALGHAMALPMLAMLTAIQNYRGLPHRCTVVKKENNITWIDDSKATNVGACIAAIEGLKQQGNLILLAGGVGKDQDFSPLTQPIADSVSCVILLGQDAPIFEAVLPNNVAVIHAISMDDAVEQARRIAKSGDIVLLSPACASFDMFSGYAERGDKFAQAVLNGVTA